MLVVALRTREAPANYAGPMRFLGSHRWDWEQLATSSQRAARLKGPKSEGAERGKAPLDGEHRDSIDGAARAPLSD